MLVEEICWIRARMKTSFSRVDRCALGSGGFGGYLLYIYFYSPLATWISCKVLFKPRARWENMVNEEVELC
jgi:hypothetical protein